MNTLYFALGAWCGAVTVCLLFMRGANPPEQVGQQMELSNEHSRNEH